MAARRDPTDIVRANGSLAALTQGRRLLLVIFVCGGAAWLADPIARLIVATSLLLLAPGYLIARVLPGPRPHLLTRLALWVGLSLSAVALTYQWLWFLGLSLKEPGLGILTGLLAAAAAVAVWRDLGAPPQPASSGTSRQSPTTPTVFWLLMALICALTGWTRVVQIEALALPAWVDSVHHALLVRIAAETGLPPIALEPYMPVHDLPYHWGYHVFTASVLALSGVGLPETILWTGQILNALHAPMAGALAIVLWRRPAAAVGAALVVGLVSLMPAYYVSWGRYTQLAGLLLLPGLAFAWGQALAITGRQGLRASLPAWAVASVLLAGLTLIHIRVFAFALALLAAQTLVWLASTLGTDASVGPLPRLRRLLTGAPAGFVGGLLAGVGALVLAVPWLSLVARRALLPALERPASLVLEGNYNSFNLGLLWVGHNRMLVALALVALGLGLWRRASAAAVLPLWVGLLLVMANPRLLGYLLPVIGAPLLFGGIKGKRYVLAAVGVALILFGVLMGRVPSTWLINNEAVIISLFLPLGVAIGGGSALLYVRARRLRPLLLRRAVAPLAVGVTVAVASWGAWQLRSVVNEQTIIATAADRAAVEWVAANTPPDARFLINATPWLGIAERSTDGGWWLLPLAGRWTSTPPVLFPYGPAAYVQATIERNQALAAYRPGGEAAILDLMRRDGIDYLYFGSLPGALRPEAFAGLPGLTRVYSQDGVTILAMQP